MTNESACILVVEDDLQINQMLCYILQGEGYTTRSAATVAEAREALGGTPVDLMLLDLGLPDGDGMEILHHVRRWSQLPVLIVSARSTDRDKAAALDGGADDYLTKPFSAAELLARIRVALRHLSLQGGRAAQAVLSTGDLRLDPEQRQVFLQGTGVHLTKMEYQLLELLFHNLGKVLTTGAIIKVLWGAGYGTDTQALRALMTGLRRKIEPDPARPRYIQTEIGVGYRLAVQQEAMRSQ